MPNCQSIDPLVTPYIDDQLPEADRAAVERHLLACPPCHSRVAAERAVRTLIQSRKATLARDCASGRLRATCAAYARLQAAQPHRMSAVAATRAPSGWRARATPLALAASLVMLVGGAFTYQLTSASSRVLAAELAADHVKCFAMNDVLRTHQDAAAVEGYMLSGFGWRMHVPSAPAAGLELVGARPCLYGEGKIAHIMYRQNGEPVSLFMLPNTARRDEVVEALGHEASIWCTRDRTFVLVARKPRPEIDQLAAVVQASLR